MTWRFVVVSNQYKLNYKDGYMVLRGEDLRMIHLSEINTLLIDSTQVSISAYLLSELTKNKIKVIFCDEKRNPVGELMPYYNFYHSSRSINLQMEWKETCKNNVWKEIVKTKISNQGRLLEKYNIEQSFKVNSYALEVTPGDETNREGHAAKVYFNALFGNKFSRDDDCDINAALNYGYTILLSTFNREIVSYGYLTQLGIKHKSEFNPFNLSCDLMETFRGLIDDYVYSNKDREFNQSYKYDLIGVFNKQIYYDNQLMYVGNAIKKYVHNVIDALCDDNTEELCMPQILYD